MTREAEAKLEGFIAAYDPVVAACMRDALARLSARLPGAVRLVYDNYNALAVSFGPSERPSEAILSLAAYPRWVSLFLVRGAELDDPAGLLRGGGRRIRSVRLRRADDVDSPAVVALIEQAAAEARAGLADAAKGKLVIRSISAKQRPRKPR